MYEINKILSIVGTIVVSITASNYFLKRNSQKTINNKFKLLKDELNSKLVVLTEKITSIQGKLNSLEDTDRQITEINKSILFLNNILETGAVKQDNETDCSSPSGSDEGKGWFPFIN